MPTIKYTREDITKLENERDQYKRERDLLIEDIELLRKNQKTREEVIEQLKSENKALRLQADEYFEGWQEMINMYGDIKKHIQDKADANPSEHRYFNLIHFIRDLERE